MSKTPRREVIINCIVSNDRGDIIQTFSVDYMDQYERSYLGQQAKSALLKGHRVTTYKAKATNQ